MDSRVLFLLVQGEMTTATIVHLNEVELQFIEVIVGIHLLVAIHSHIGVLGIAITDAATSAIARVAVNTSLQALGVNVIANHFQSVGKSLRMNAYLSFGRTPILEAIINIYILITGILQSLRNHSIGLSLDDILGYVNSKGVP